MAFQEPAKLIKNYNKVQKEEKEEKCIFSPLMLATL